MLGVPFRTSLMPMVGASSAREPTHPVDAEVRRLSTPIAEELDFVPHGRDGQSGTKVKDTAQLLANREPLLRRQDYTGMVSPGTDPLRVKSIEVGHVERVEDTLAFGSEGQLLLVGLPGQTLIHYRDHCDTTRTKGRDQTTMHRIFVEVQLNLIHGCRSTPVLSFENLGLAVLGCQVRVDFFLIGIVIGKSRMNLRQRQVTAERLYDLFRNLTHVVPLSNPPNRNTRPSDARSAAANLGASRDQATYLGYGCHDFKYKSSEEADKRVGIDQGDPQPTDRIGGSKAAGTRPAPSVWKAVVKRSAWAKQMRSRGQACWNRSQCGLAI
jgi:hypothetical protein